MEVTDRVHVVAHGWEVARIMDPVYKLKADTVVLILPENDSYMPEFEHEMVADLESAHRIELQTRRANLYDLGSVLQAFTQAVKDHEGEDVYINTSTGTNVAAIAGMIAAQTSDATPFYVKPALPGQKGPDGITKPDEPVIQDSGDIRELPVFELRGPSPEQLRVLAYLYGREGATKKELIEYAESEQLPFIANTEAESEEGRYRLLESHVIESLTGGNYVSVKKAGRKKVVHIEQRGVDALAAFPLDSETVELLTENSEDSSVTVEDLHADHHINWSDKLSATRGGSGTTASHSRESESGTSK